MYLIFYSFCIRIDKYENTLLISDTCMTPCAAD